VSRNERLPAFAKPAPPGSSRARLTTPNRYAVLIGSPAPSSRLYLNEKNSPTSQSVMVSPVQNVATAIRAQLASGVWRRPIIHSGGATRIKARGIAGQIHIRDHCAGADIPKGLPHRGRARSTPMPTIVGKVATSGPRPPPLVSMLTLIFPRWTGVSVQFSTSRINTKSLPSAPLIGSISAIQNPKASDAPTGAEAEPQRCCKGAPTTYTNCLHASGSA
jgi:hypothetical protein